MDETGIFDILNTSLIFWEVIAFFILLFLLVRYVYPPIREQILERQSEIERAIDEAEKTRAEARELLAEYRRQIEARAGRSLRTPASRRKPSASGPRERPARRATASSSAPARR
jgi:F-type H+-transporting ATPase subunit b